MSDKLIEAVSQFLARDPNKPAFAREEVEINEADYGFFGTKNPNIGDRVQHKSGASGRIKSISTQGNDTHVHFKLDNDTKIMGLPHKKGEMVSFHAKHVTPMKEEVEELEELSKLRLS